LLALSLFVFGVARALHSAGYGDALGSLGFLSRRLFYLFGRGDSAFSVLLQIHLGIACVSCERRHLEVSFAYLGGVILVLTWL
jgi:hypothetical protein